MSAVNSVNFTVDRGPMARESESHPIARIGAYGGRPEAVCEDGSCAEVWITLDYGASQGYPERGLYLRLDRETAIKLNQRISDLLAPVTPLPK